MVLQSNNSDSEDGEDDGYYESSDDGSDPSSFIVFKRPAPRGWGSSVVDVILTRRRAFTMIGLTAAVLLGYSLFASSAPLEPRQGIATTSPPWYPTRWWPIPLPSDIVTDSHSSRRNCEIMGGIIPQGCRIGVADDVDGEGLPVPTPTTGSDRCLTACK